MFTLVTGGAKGLGAEISRTLAKEGQDILVHYRKSEIEAHQVVKECQSFGVQAKAVQGDFSTPEGVQDILFKIQEEGLRVANLINNVGNFLIAPPTQTTEKEWIDLFQVNLHAPFALIRGLMTSIKDLRGSIIQIGVAGASEIRADPKYTAYTTTKRSLFLLTKALASELAPVGVRVNMVSPGELENSVSLPSAKLPMKRAGTFVEVAHVVAYLMKEENRYITGQNIEVAGGYAL